MVNPGSTGTPANLINGLQYASEINVPGHKACIETTQNRGKMDKHGRHHRNRDRYRHRMAREHIACKLPFHGSMLHYHIAEMQNPVPLYPVPSIFDFDSDADFDENKSQQCDLTWLGGPGLLLYKKKEQDRIKSCPFKTLCPAQWV